MQSKKYSTYLRKMIKVKELAMILRDVIVLYVLPKSEMKRYKIKKLFFEHLMGQNVFHREESDGTIE